MVVLEVAITVIADSETTVVKTDQTEAMKVCATRQIVVRKLSKIHFTANGDSFNGRGRGRGRDGGGDRGRTDDRENDGSFSDRPKEFYIPPDPSTDEAEIFSQGISSGINFAKYDKIPITITGDKPAKHILSFRESGLSDFLITNVEKSGYKDPTPIQKTAIPNIMAKRDLMACAQTGSGKTAGR